VVRVLPGDPALIIIGPDGSPEAAARLREAMGLNRPIAVQYAEWLTGALRGDLGKSLQYDVPVGRLIVSRLPVTLPLALMAATLMVVTALPLGLFAARHHRRVGDYLAMVVSQIGIAVPGFWAGLQLGQLVAGAIILESVFALPGLGRLALGAITARDLPVVQGVTLFVASSIVFINFAVDLLYVVLDPRIRYD